MGNFGIKIAKSGKDVYSTNRNDYIFWSKYETRSFYNRYSGTLVLSRNDPDRTVSVSIYHNLGYYPYAWVFYSDCNNNYLQLPSEIIDCVVCNKGESPNFYFYYIIYSDRIDLHLTAECYIWQGGTYNILSDITVNYEVIIFREKIK